MARHEISAEQTIQAAPDKVYKVVADPARIAEWMPNVSDVQLTNAKKGVGATRHIRMKMHDTILESEQRVTVAEPSKRFEWVHERDQFQGKPFDMLEDVGTRVEFAPVGKATHVKATAFFSPKGLKAKLAAPLFTKDVRKQMQAALDKLKEIVETS